MAVEGNTMDNKLYNVKASSQAVAHDLTKAYSTLESALRSQLTQQILIKVGGFAKACTTQIGICVSKDPVPKVMG